MESVSLLSIANTAFALDLYKKFNEEDNTGNIFCSPFSISAALAMTRLGAAGNTLTQMSEVLHFSEPQPEPEGGASQNFEQMQCQMQSQMQSQMQTQMQTRMQSQMQTRMQLLSQIRKRFKPQDDEDNVDESFGQLLRELNKPDASYALSVANRLYGEQALKIKELFLAETKKYYDAQLETVDFQSNAEGVRININNWVEKQTQGKITNLLPPNSVDSLTRLVLVNAIYFKGKWQTQFKEEDTIDAEFRLSKNETKTVRMMQKLSTFPLRSVDEVNCQVLELPYKGKDLSMIIILPNDIEDDTTGLEKLEKALTYEKFEEWTGTMDQVKVNVSLPRFKLEQRYDLSQTLKSMGMEDAFNINKSDFSGMSEATNLAITAVVHKAFVEVNEEGTEAAAATGVVVGTTSFIIPKTFNADHPFLFFIRHNQTNSVLFAGRFSSPE